MKVLWLVAAIAWLTSGVFSAIGGNWAASNHALVMFSLSYIIFLLRSKEDRQ